jgi:hypothetical protein
MNHPARGSARSWVASVSAPSVAVAALVVAGLFALVAAGQALWPDATLAAEPATLAGMPAVRVPQRQRCETCGVIQDIRRVEATPGAPAGYEFSVLLPNGELRLSRALAKDQWEIGDRMQLLGGGRTWSASP